MATRSEQGRQGLTRSPSYALLKTSYRLIWILRREKDPAKRLSQSGTVQRGKQREIDLAQIDEAGLDVEIVVTHPWTSVVAYR